MTAILKVDLPASCVTEYWCKITRQQIIPAGFFYSRRALEEGIRTGDLARGAAAVSTDEMGDIIARYVAEGV